MPKCRLAPIIAPLDLGQIASIESKLPFDLDSLANQFRLLVHTAAYCLFWLLRHLLQGTALVTAQFNTLRVRLLKIGAHIRETGRRIWVHLASGYPYRDMLALVLQNLRSSPT